MIDPFIKDVLTIGFSSASLIISLISLTIGILNYHREGGMLKFNLDYERKNINGVIWLKIENKGYHSIKINGSSVLNVKLTKG